MICLPVYFSKICIEFETFFSILLHYSNIANYCQRPCNNFVIKKVEKVTFTPVPKAGQLRTVTEKSSRYTAKMNIKNAVMPHVPALVVQITHGEISYDYANRVDWFANSFIVSRDNSV